MLPIAAPLKYCFGDERRITVDIACKVCGRLLLDKIKETGGREGIVDDVGSVDVEVYKLVNDSITYKASDATDWC